MAGMDPSQVPAAREIVISAHEAAHAVASIRLGLPFAYVTFGDEDGDGPRVEAIDNLPRPIPFYRGGGDCCREDSTICQTCRDEQTRAESWMVMAMCGSLGSRATGCDLFGYGQDADKAYVGEFCRKAFGDATDDAVNRRISAMLDRAIVLMQPEGRPPAPLAGRCVNDAGSQRQKSGRSYWTHQRKRLGFAIRLYDTARRKTTLHLSRVLSLGRSHAPESRHGCVAAVALPTGSCVDARCRGRSGADRTVNLVFHVCGRRDQC